MLFKLRSVKNVTNIFVRQIPKPASSLLLFRVTVRKEKLVRDILEIIKALMEETKIQFLKGSFLFALITYHHLI